MAGENIKAGINAATNIAPETIVSLGLNDATKFRKTYKTAGTIVTSNVPGSGSNGLPDDEILPPNSSLIVDSKVTIDMRSKLRANGVPDIASGGSGGSGGSGSSYDTDSQAYMTAVSMSSAAHKNAVDTYVTGLKSSGVWGKVKGLYPFYGTTIDTGKINLKNPSAKPLTQSGAGTFATGYTQGSGDSAGLYTGILPTEFSGGITMALVLKAISTNSIAVELGIMNGGSDYIRIADSGSISAFSGSSDAAQALITTMASQTGVGIWSVNVSGYGNASTIKAFHDGSASVNPGANVNPATVNNAGRATQEFIIGNGFAAIGTATDAKFGVVMFADVLTDAENVSFNSLTQAFETAIRA